MHQQDYIGFEELGQRELMKATAGVIIAIVTILAQGTLYVACKADPSSPLCTGIAAT